MIASALAGAILTCVLVAEVSDPPLQWSPSGDWITFVVATPSVEHSLASFPIFPVDQRHDEIYSEGLESKLTYRIWAVRVQDGQAIKIAEGPDPMTSPNWGPDGTGIAFGRVVRGEEESPGHWEIVIARGDDHEVIASRELDPDLSFRDSIVGEAVAWTPDGEFLAVPDPERTAIELINIESGELHRRIEDSKLLSFSPIGHRMAFFRSRGDRWEIVEGHPEGGPEADRPIDSVSRADQAPIWTSDGQTLLYHKLSPTSEEGLQTRLCTYRIGDDNPRKIKEIENPSMVGETILGTFLTIADDGLDQYFLVQYSNRPVAISFHRGDQPLDRFHPLAGFGMLGAPSLSPNRDQIAIRFAGPGARSLPGLISTTSKKLSPLVPDDDLMAAWLVALAESVESQSNPEHRPTRLPSVAELGEPGPSSTSYKLISELGSRFTDEFDTEKGRNLPTSRPGLFFAYLNGDYERANRALEELIDCGSNPDEAVRLLGLQAQICLARGNDAEAREILTFVKQQYRERVARVEADGTGGFNVSREGLGVPTWSEELWRLHQNRLDPKPDQRPEVPEVAPFSNPSPFDKSANPGTISPPERL